MINKALPIVTSTSITDLDIYLTQTHGLKIKFHGDIKTTNCRLKRILNL